MAEAKSIRVLCMEDDLGLARLLQKNLSRQGYDVELAANGREGLDLLARSLFDVILVDYTMPVCGGMEVIRSLAGCDNVPPAIMVTGNGSEKLAVEAMKAGAADYIVKDVERGFLELLPMVIEQVLNKQQLVKEREQALEKIRILNEELEVRVAQRTSQLMASNQELEGFCYTVSHDLRAPLNRLQAYSQILREENWGQLDGQGKFYVERIEIASRQLKETIDALLDLAFFTRSELNRQTVDLSGMASAITEDLQRAEPGRAVTFTITPSIECEGDPKLIRVVLENLLGNAWKFTEKQDAGHIEFGRTVKAGKMIYFVRDNGAGFDMKYVNKLFKPFQRLHTEQEFEGTGIGLASVQRIIQLHGGDIWAEGEVGNGATVSFTLR